MKISFNDIKNDTNLEFTNISSEAYRVYNTVPNLYKFFTTILLLMIQPSKMVNILQVLGILYIKEPIGLHVSKSGGHRVIDSAGKCYYIKNYTSIEWGTKKDHPHFVK